MSLSTITVKENIRFDEALQLTQTFLELLKKNELSPDRIANFVASLVKTENGARGFFVIFLTGDDEICDRTHPEIIEGLKASPDITAELLVKNVAMSTAQAIFHHRNQDEEKAASSIAVARRSSEMIKQLNLPKITELGQQLLTTIQTGNGEYTDFLNRWGYDDEQKATIANVISQLIL
jgi:hypothetical protein